MQVFRWVVVYLLVLELMLGIVMPGRIALGPGQRMSYPVVEKNSRSVDIYLESVQHQIEEQHLDDYIVILGDSVAYSGPGPSSQSIAAHLQRIAGQQGTKAPQIFNLSFPAMQTGDIYTMLLKLDQYGISTDRVIINVLYAGFLPRDPGPPPVFWLKQDLKELDKVSYTYSANYLYANGYQEPRIFYGTLKNQIWQQAALLKYKDFIRLELQEQWSAFKHDPLTDDSIGDARPWYEKPELPELLQQDQYQRDFSDQAINLDESNPQVYFLEKIEEYQRNKHTLVFLAGTNQDLMKAQVSRPGYKANLQAIDGYMSDQSFDYINLQGKIPDMLFTDHVHFTGEGYYEAARLLWQEWTRS